MAISKPAKSKNSLKNSEVDAKPSFKETTKKEDILTENREAWDKKTLNVYKEVAVELLGRIKEAHE
ncbi:hypothetical protein [Limosilactobacillus reuteri]|uniref:hypothetical protein n=1 Tax=Limosilactobacillus reuteri TaxID=1598 RepID=UPI002074ABB4|nr:hypothetical protein [Limosilactobacillus reuteri]